MKGEHVVVAEPPQPLPLPRKTREKGKGKDEGKVVQKKTYVYEGFRCSNNDVIIEKDDDGDDTFILINTPNHQRKNFN